MNQHHQVWTNPNFGVNLSFLWSRGPQFAAASIIDFCNFPNRADKMQFTSSMIKKKEA